MASKIIKEIIMLLLTCLVCMLLFAVIFYEYIPSKKIVPEVEKYTVSEKDQALMADDVDKRNDQVVLTYKVTGADLNNYKATNEYVPGKANPFATVQQDVETNATTDANNTNNTNTTGNNTSSDTNTNSNGTTGTPTDGSDTDSGTGTSSNRLFENDQTK